MAVLGVNPLAVEVTAFVISAGLAGFAGVLLAYEKAFVYPTLFSVETSARVLLMVVMGGAGTLLGPVVGAFLVEFIRGIGSVYTDRWQTILGLLAVIVALNSREFLLGGVLSFFRGKFRGSAAEQFASGKRIEGAVRTSPVVSTPLQPAGAPRVVGRRKEGALVKADNIVKHFGGLSVLDGISLEIAPGERRGIIGPNGAGKTTFLNILSSTLLPTAGRIYYGGNDITALPEFRRARLGIGRTFQIANLFNDCTVRENLVLALVARQDYGLRFGRPLSRYVDVQREAIELLEKWNVRKIADIKVKLLSYGERRVIEIVLALATRPQLLLLDEPAAGLSSSETKRIIETISALDPGLSIVIVDHNMDLIFSTCDRVTVFANGQVLAEGVGDDVRRNKLVMEAYLGMPL
jgi:branched-chain amino acid transport system permease protein